MRNYRSYRLLPRPAALVIGIVLAVIGSVLVLAASQELAGRHLTPLQLEIERQRQQLNSVETEERREAVTRLGSMHHPAASRAAVVALNDPTPIVRATAAGSVLSLPAVESAASLLPLLADRDEFVRQQVAYALGQTRSRTAVAALIERLVDKKDSVRGAAAVALGQIADAAAVSPLAALLSPQAVLPPTKDSKKIKRERNLLVLRAAARSLGQIGSRAAVPALIAVIEDEKVESDLRREAALALGLTGDPAAIPALQLVLNARDPYLSQAAHEAIRKLSGVQNRPGR